MPDSPGAPPTLSPLLTVLQDQIIPEVHESGMDNIVIAHPSWEVMQRSELPRGASIAHKPLKSKRVPIRGKRNYESQSATVDARWPEDGLHSNQMPILMFVVAGSVAIPLGDYVLRCNPCTGVLILPGTPHPDGSHLCLDDFNRETGFCNMISFKAWGNGIICWLNHSREGRHWSGALGEACHIFNPQARVYLERLTEEAQTNPPHFRAMCDGLLRVMMTLLLREIQTLRAFRPVRLRAAEFEFSHQSVPEHDPIVRVEEFVRTHLHEELSIDRVAAYAYMSRAYFTRRFREATGTTFNEYLTRCRLEAAKVLLQNTEGPVNKISESVGITPARLRILFRQRENLTPGEFRRQVRGR